MSIRHKVFDLIFCSLICQIISKKINFISPDKGSLEKNIFVWWYFGFKLFKLDSRTHRNLSKQVLTIISSNHLIWWNHSGLKVSRIERELRMIYGHESKGTFKCEQSFNFDSLWCSVLWFLARFWSLSENEEVQQRLDHQSYLVRISWIVRCRSGNLFGSWRLNACSLLLNTCQPNETHFLITSWNLSALVHKPF